MVGVAGKSKACNTCRQRKISCDLQRPQCSQCIKSNRVCTGYQRKRVFILHQGKAGEPRDNSAKSASGARETCLGSDSDAATVPRNTGSRRASARVGQIALRNSNLSPAAYRKQVFNAYLCCHMPMAHLTSLDVPWITLVPDLVAPTEALEMSTLALATAKLGRLNSDPALVKESLRLYTMGLQELQKALWDPTLMYRDETLGACMALATYEIAECPAGNKSAYLSHYSGLETLVRLRGPEAHASGLGHYIFLIFRIHGILQAMERHTPSYLSTPAWTQSPWTTIPKGQFDQLFDLFSRGPAIFQLVDRLNGADPHDQPAIAVGIVEQCWKLDADLSKFYEELEQSTLGPLYWPQFSKSDDAMDDQDKLFPIAFQFPNLGTARTLMLYWATLTMLWSGLYQLYQLFNGIKETTQFDMTKLPPLGHRKDFLSVARDVCQSVEYCMQDEMLGAGPILVTAPLSILVETMKDYPSFQRELVWARSVFGTLYASGMRILK